MLVISDDAYEQLRQILEEQTERSYSLEEIKEIGDELLDFYMLLVSIERRISRSDLACPGGDVDTEVG